MAEQHPEITEVRTVYDDGDASNLLSEGWILLDWGIHEGDTVFILGFDEVYAEAVKKINGDDDEPLTPLSERYEGTL